MPLYALSALFFGALYGISRGVPNPEPVDEHRERQIDALIAKSRTWVLVQAAIAETLARHPAAARDVARALREVEL